MASEVEHDPVFDELVRCASCGSLNDPSAEWCGQCLAAFVRVPEPSLASDLNALGSALVEPEPRLNPEVESGFFGIERGSPVWRCARCFTRNPMGSEECSDCGQTFTESAKREAGAFTHHLAEDSARTTMGIVGWGARFMLVIGGLVAPVVLLWTALAGAVGYLLKWMLGRDR